MLKHTFHTTLLVMCCFCVASAQPSKTSTQTTKKKELTYEDAFEKNYQKRIKKERINGVYIPKDMSQCLLELTRLTDAESRAKFKTIEEEEAVRKIHFSLGRWIIHNWGFYEGSRLSVAINNMGISNPDDMAQFIIRSFHRSLNKKELKIKEQLEYYQELQMKRQEERKKKQKVISSTTRKRAKN